MLFLKRILFVLEHPNDPKRTDNLDEEHKSEVGEGNRVEVFPGKKIYSDYKNELEVVKQLARKLLDLVF
jgi:hypothetical protein